MKWTKADEKLLDALDPLHAVFYAKVEQAFFELVKQVKFVGEQHGSPQVADVMQIVIRDRMNQLIDDWKEIERCTVPWSEFIK